MAWTDSALGCERLASLMQALASPVRLRILAMLAREALCVKVIAARLDVSQPAASQHLRVLRHVGMVVARRRAGYVHYRLDRQALLDCQAGLAGLTEQRGCGTPLANGACQQRHRLSEESET